MMQVPNRILRRLDDRRVVFRLHDWAKAVILTDGECERVQRMVWWSTALQVVLTLAMGLSALAAYVSLPLRSFAIALALVLLIVVVLIERGYARAIASVLDRAPLSVADNVKPPPSASQFIFTPLKRLLFAISDRKLRNLLVQFVVLLLATLWRIFADVLGIDSPQPKMSTFQIALFLLISPLGLKVVLAERRRRAAEKQIAEKAAL